MNSVLKFDRYILIKELNDCIKKVGDTFEVANILEDSFLLREAKSKVAVGVISFEDFDKYFIPEENFTGWTRWTPLVGFDGQNDVVYRTNKRRVQVKFVTNKVRAEACCHKGDDFNLYFGIQMAYLRCLNKALKKQKLEYEDKLKSISCEIVDNNKIIEKMLSSLNA